jgi:hypothetical protein
MDLKNLSTTQVGKLGGKETPEGKGKEIGLKKRSEDRDNLA